MEASLKHLPIGGSHLRIDSRAKVTGQAHYAEDITLPGLLHGKVLRSPHHHARLAALDPAPALSVPGVVRVITAEDIPGVNGLDDYSRDEPVLTPVGETVRMVGAPIAFVVAETRQAAEEGARAVVAVYEPLPYHFDAATSLAEGAPPIYPQGNRLTEEGIRHGDTEEAFAASDRVLEATYQTAFQEHSALERESALGYLDEEGRVTVVCGTHEPHWQQKYIALALDIPREQVRVIMPPTGGSFGGKQDPWPLIAAGLMTYLTQRPVRLVYTRHESFDASPKRHPYTCRYTVGATREGRLTGLKARFDINTGGYDAHGQYIPAYAVMASGGAYRWQAVDVHAQSIYTNGPKCGQFRGFGSPQPTFALECTLDELIEQLGAHPIDFRRKNHIEQSEPCFLGYRVAERLGYAEALEAIRPAYDAWQSEALAFNADPSNGPLRKGVGVSGMWYRFGKSGALRVETRAELASDGHFILYCSAPDYGQGINTVMVQIAAETLGVSRDAVELVNADTATTPDSGIQGASRATYWVGSSVVQAAATLRMGILAAAAEMLDCAPDVLTMDSGSVVCPVRLDCRVSLAEVAEEFNRQGRPRTVTGVFDLASTFPDGSRPQYTPHFVTGANVTEVLVDTETGQTQVTRVVAAHDVGRAINPPDASGQIEGSVLMGIGAALLEEYVPGRTTGFTDYILPMIHAMPDIQVILIEVPGYEGPFGAKGLGEAAILPATPAVINAVSRAVGVRIRTLPATGERILAALNGIGRA
jgi:CO/xanthine dehydrogenase Mo-binding subunit